MANKYPDLNQFDGKEREEICQQLVDEGYEILRRGSLCTVYHQPGSDFAVRVSINPNTVSVMCDTFKKFAGNPFLPNIYAHKTINSQAHVAIVEKLVSLEELAEKDSNHTNFGIARAVASFPHGDNVHEDVHAAMASDPQLVQAVRALVECGRTALQKHGAAGDSLYLDRDVDGILFRVNEGAKQPVFANSLCYTTPNDLLEAEFKRILHRMDDLEGAHKKTPAVNARQSSLKP